MKDPFGYHNKTQELKGRSVLSGSDNVIDSSAAEGVRAEASPIIDPRDHGRRFVALFVCIGLAGLILTLRVVYMQQTLGTSLTAAAEENRIRNVPIPAPRGVIYDRNGVVLAKNTASFSVVALLQKYDEQVNSDVLSGLADFLGIGADEITAAVEDGKKKGLETVAVADDIDRDKALIFKATADRYPGFVVDEKPQREYVAGETFSHALGYTGRITKEEYEQVQADGKHYGLSDTIGKTGIEKYYEDILRGSNGARQVEQNSLGVYLRDIAQTPPEPGADVYLTINASLQQFIANRIAERGPELNFQKGVVLAMDPKNGEVLALASFPSFDNNLFSKGIDQETYQNLLQDERNPLFNRAVSGMYPIGSTIKPFVAAAALQEGVITTGTVIQDNGVITVPNQYNPDILYRFYSWKRSGLGPMTVYSAIAQSSDIYFFYAGGGFDDFTGMGVDTLAGYYRNFLFGVATGIDLPSEAKGNVPTPAWKEETKGESWFLGDTYNVSIGQGDFLATPLQLAANMSAIANGTDVSYVPHLLKSVRHTGTTEAMEDTTKKARNESFIDQRNVDIVKDAMRRTVTEGSAGLLQDVPVDVCAKTGTAQFNNNTQEHAWLVSFAPCDNPDVVLVVLGDGAGGSGSVAVPLANDIWLYYYGQTPPPVQATNVPVQMGAGD